MISRQRLFKVLVLVAVLFAVVIVYRSLGRYTWAEIQASVRSIPVNHLISSLGFVIASYICLTGFDWLAVRYAGRPLSYPRAALASFTGLSIGHNVGLAALSSGAVRYRFYSRWGLSPAQVAKVIVFCGVTVGIGLTTLASLALLSSPGGRGDMLGLSATASVVLGVTILAVPGGYLVLCWRVRRSLTVGKWSFEPPPLHLALGQVVVGTLNFACVAGAIHQLMSSVSDVGYLSVATAYVTSNIASLVSHVPGGLGVLEATMLGLLPHASAIGALVAFRVLYFFVPLMIGVPVLIASEAYFKRRSPTLAEQTAS
ncbi:lysylphosphatidylglycerol synthase domain-containing protein [Rhizobium halophilum]|uniref:lysylphosphatidylglycerol synthase domain-containing protein n=1 Tax=Rhizobium halophilum TaxID=2846852 RepID=UPI001EFEE8DC|nr:lysylphosphatidylglycerol synthase domain-containing protein [Rhizobium halophilum]MCF6367984.1 lysylphosphatidylglycerol synthase domain-containing protein [Rhizobium halophilum]